MMCRKTVRFPSSLDEELRRHESPRDECCWYRKSMEERPSIDETSQQLIQSVWEAVLDEQIDQWASGESDPERMATVYRQHSASSLVKAIVDGLKVQEEAARCTTE